ncbi:uncharacterized protein LOC107359662 [Tetranychus urticae]|uniref:Cyclin N-terminal domain-containing protein n=1 Tax=Tetranychus urticae TaxID=32264 RepID=T1K2U2_TETUR|nr:uncharacterized protein LOC107359662 [Tetranychus urticae]XP_015781680.1 uncharacterized protein LOC107359662 [Tetranychus urticae]
MSRIPRDWYDILNVDGDLDLICTELLVDMLKKASEQSQAIFAGTDRKFFIWELEDYNKLVSFIFDLCSSLHMDDDFVKYNSCELYEEFLYRHIENLKSQIANGTVEEEKNLWYNIKHQALLRLISCIMLSSKISSMRATKYLNDFHELMKSYGQKYSKNAILRSEIRVLKTVDFKVDRCLLYAICPLLILTLSHNEPNLDAKLFYSILHKIMDYYYLAKSDIFKRLFEVLSRQSVSKSQFVSLMNNTMLIGSAIVAAAPMLVNEKDAPQVLTDLAFITCYDEKDICTIRDVILEGLLASK